MTLRAELLPLLLVLAMASFACRASGFWLMRFVTVTPRLAAALRAAPLAVMVGIATPAATRGSPPEMAGLAAVGIVMWLTRSELTAAMAGVATVAIVRRLLDG